MQNYARIYRLRCRRTGKTYIGSTTLPLNKRLTHHRSHWKMYQIGRYPSYLTSFEIMKEDMPVIELIEETSTDEMLARERHFIENTECVNKVVPTRTRIEYYLDNRDEIREKRHDHYLKNRDRIREERREFYHNNWERLNARHDCDCGGRYTLVNRSHHMNSRRHKDYLTHINDDSESY